MTNVISSIFKSEPKLDFVVMMSLSQKLNLSGIILAAYYRLTFLSPSMAIDTRFLSNFLANIRLSLWMTLL